MTHETHLLLTPRLQSSAQPRVSPPRKSGTSQEKSCKPAPRKALVPTPDVSKTIRNWSLELNLGESDFFHNQ